MNERPIRVLIADDSALSRHMLSQVISAQPDMTIVGSAVDGREAVRLAIDLQPDVVLMDVHMPDVDGIQAAWLFSSKVPHGAVIMVTVEAEADFVQKALAAGARNYVTKPIGDGTELLESVRSVHRASLARQLRPSGTDSAASALPPARGTRIAVFGSKGGVGKTTLAVSLALALQQQAPRGAALVDADFMFGDCATHLAVTPIRTIVDLVPHARALDASLVRQVMTPHSSGLELLAPPERPEHAEIISAQLVRGLLDGLSALRDYVVIDTEPSYDEHMLAVLDLADVHVVVLPSQLGALHNTRHFLDVAKILGFSDARVLFVLNRSNSLAGLSMDEIRSVVGPQPIFEVPSAGASLAVAVNTGTPLILSDPGSPFSIAVRELAGHVRDLTGESERASA